MTNPKVDFFFENDSPWQKEFNALRKIALQCGLEEELKWGQACYTWHNKNIVLIHGFKDYCALLFFKGALLNDGENLLVQQTKNVQAARQLRFTSSKEITSQSKKIQAFIQEAIMVEESGIAVPMKKTEAFDMPEEFAKVLKKNSHLKKAFEDLTPGRQRGYLLHFAQAKQAKTREARIEKATPAIMQGKGLMDK